MAQDQQKDLLVINSSGGLDSTVLIYHALNTMGIDVLLVNYVYGQNHKVEIHVQKKLYKRLKKKFGSRILGNIKIDLSPIYKAEEKIFSDLKSIRDSQKIKDKTSHEFYTPSRNLLFMATASAFGELTAITQGYNKLFLGIGVHKHSEEAYGSGNKTQYWDITPEFIKALQRVLTLNDTIPIEIYAPYKDKYKSSIIKDMIKYKINFKKTWTCYDPVEDFIQEEEEDNPILTFTPCNICEACKERSLQSKDILKKDINKYVIKIK